MAGGGGRRMAARIIIPVAFYPQPFSSKSSQAWLLATRHESFLPFLYCVPHMGWPFLTP